MIVIRTLKVTDSENYNGIWIHESLNEIIDIYNHNISCKIRPESYLVSNRNRVNTQVI